MSKEMPIGKFELELNYPGDGRLFLNFWDWSHGNDVVAEISDGNIIIGNDADRKTITFQEFILMVENSINQQ